jgi:putative ABC transport system permease protein
MLDFDSLREIGTTIRQNKLRTFLTGFSIAWGIFMLIFLLGAGNGLKNGIESNFSRRAKNTVSVWPGSTSMPYKGLPVGRDIRFDFKDFDLIKKIPEVEYISAQVNHRGIISYEKEYGSWSMMGVHPDAGYINNIEMSSGLGRFINSIDIEKKRKVIVINNEMQDILFKGENPLGKYVTADGLAFLVIGVYKDETGRTNIPAYIPFTTSQSLYNQGYGIDRLDFTVKGLATEKANEDFIERFRQQMGMLHKFDPTDKSALSIWNTAADAVQTANIFGAVSGFIWVVGILSLMAGIVGVSNIMLITVRERTREFGIRKAIGATPWSILRSVLLEALLITVLFGYTGMIVGVGVTEIANNVTENMAESREAGEPVIFKNPTVDLGIVFLATVVLIAAGVTAGSIPAIKAVRISPVEAMRAE